MWGGGKRPGWVPVENGVEVLLGEEGVVHEAMGLVRRLSMEQSTTSLYRCRKGYPKIMSVLLMAASYPHVGGHLRVFVTSPDQHKTGREIVIEHPLVPPCMGAWSAVTSVMGDAAFSRQPGGNKDFLNKMGTLEPVSTKTDTDWECSAKKTCARTTRSMGRIRKSGQEGEPPHTSFARPSHRLRTKCPNRGYEGGAISQMGRDQEN